MAQPLGGKSKTIAKPSSAAEHRALLQRLKHLYRSDDDAEYFIDDWLENRGFANIDAANLTQLRQLDLDINRTLDDYEDAPFTDTTKEKKTVKLTATINENKKNRTVEISIEDKDGKFVTSDNKRVERDLGEDMPVYMTMPKEVFDAILAS